MWIGHGVDCTGDGSPDVFVFRQANPNWGGCLVLLALPIFLAIGFIWQRSNEDKEWEAKAAAQRQEIEHAERTKKEEENEKVRQQLRMKALNTCRSIAGFSRPSQAAELISAANDPIAIDGYGYLSQANDDLLEGFDAEPHYILNSKQIGDAEAKSLMVNRRWLFLDGLTRVTTEIASYVKGFHGRTLVLDGIRSLSPEEAKVLAGFTGDTLLLNGLATISPQVAQALAGFKGKTLVLNGITELSPGVSTALAKFKGDVLALNGIAAISDTDADVFANFSGNRLYFTGIKTLSDRAAAAFRQSPHQIEFPGAY